jgi:signal transduction histidine kinase
MAALIGALLLTACGGGLLAYFLWRHARHAPAARPLALFILLVGVWSLGLLLPNPAGAALLATAPLASAVFLHFAADLTGRGKRLVMPAYVAAAVTALAAAWFGTGRFLGTAAFRYEGAGLEAVALCLACSAIGHVLLWASWHRAAGKQRIQLGMVLTASLLGFGAVSGLALPLAGSSIPPWTLLALPAYLAVLVFAILRHELMVVNLWARRAIGWGFLVAGAALAAAALTALPAGLAAERAGFFGGWALVTVIMAVAFILAEPVRRFGDTLIFPGDISAVELAAWRAELAGAVDTPELERIASRRLGARLRTDPPPVSCRCGFGVWEVEIGGLEEAPAVPRRIAALYGDLLQQALSDLDRRRNAAEQERLAELGALAATVAHDLRNPLNIIAMAAASAAPVIRQEIAAQIARMDRLVQDLLDYAKPWRVEPETLDLGEFLAGRAETEITPGLVVRADPLRLRQALDNLLENAKAAGSRHVLVAAGEEGSRVAIHVCDDGAGIPEEIRAELFRPFISRGREGTGLGLAIVAKVAAAHGGSVSLTERPGWTTCFTLRLPA